MFNLQVLDLNSIKESIFFYVIVNAEGKFFKPTGLGRSGSKWVDSITQAKIYNKIGPARSQVTYWSKNFPSYGVPMILQFSIGDITVLDEKERVANKIDEQHKRNLLKVRRSLERQIANAEEEIHKNQEALKKLKNKL